MIESCYIVIRGDEYERPSICGVHLFLTSAVYQGNEIRSQQLETGSPDNYVSILVQRGDKTRVLMRSTSYLDKERNQLSYAEWEAVDEDY